VRTIDYLPYPANYGMIPQTLLAKDRNGDGDPLDAIVLGPALPRGTVVTVKLLGSMMMTDQNKEDSKLIGVIPHTNFSSLKSIIELDMKFPGVTKILSTWFTNYKGRGQTKIHGFKDAREAHRLLTIAVDEYREKHKKTDADASPDQ